VLLALVSAVLASVSVATHAQAQTTWVGGKGQNQWNIKNNWSNGVPSNSTTAIFPASPNSTISINNPNAIAGTLQFNAPGYSLNVGTGNSALMIFGAGIDGTSPTPTINIGRPQGGSNTVQFFGTSGAAAATFNINNGGTAAFTDSSNAQTATFNINSGGRATFSANSTGGMATLNINPGGTLDLSGHSVPGFPTPTNMTASSVSDNGQILLGTAPTVAGNTLTVGTYNGSGGKIFLNTFLGSDNSPSDQLVIKGTATGSTSLDISNVGGPGSQTTANGILVVNALPGATTAPGAFTLDNPELRAGAFDYRLFRGGINGSDPNDWFLRSTFIVPPVPPSTQPISPPVPQSTQPIPPLALPNGLPPDPPPAVLPPGLWPIIGPELATDGVVQPIARQIGLQTLGTLHQRIGDTLTLANTGGDGAGVARSDWARFFGQGIDNSYQAFADPRSSGWMGGFQGGVNLLRSSFLPGHRDVAGVYLAFANSDISVNGMVTNAAATGYVQSHTGTVGINGYSAGGYWTHYGPSGWYLDAVLQGTYYNGNAITQFANLPINGSGFISSLEGGYPIPLPLGPLFVLEPQAQIIWQQVSFNEANDGLGPVGLGTTSGSTGRVGLRGMWTIIGENGQVWQPYVRANLWRDWGAEATTTFGIDQVPLVEEATRLEFAGGVTAKLGPGVSLYAQASYQFAPNEVYIRNGIQGDIGLRYVW
jgi:outer membrane autotransporter protein